MNDHLADMVRDAQRRRADQAPPTDRLMAVLRDVEARQPTGTGLLPRPPVRRWGLVAAAASATVVALIITVPVLVFGPGGTNSDRGTESVGAPGNGSTAAPSPAQTTPPALTAQASLRYRPAWLPPGLTEGSRSISLSAYGATYDVARTWSRGPFGSGIGAGKVPRLTLSIADPGPGGSKPGAGGVPVDVNGHNGVINTGEGKARLTWSMDDRTEIAVSQNNLDLSTEQLLRVARSVTADQTVTRVPIRLTWLPAGLNVMSGSAYGNSPTDVATLMEAATAVPATVTPGDRSRDIRLAFGPGSGPTRKGEALSVGGRPAWWEAAPGSAPDGAPNWAQKTLFVDYGNGLWLSVNCTSYGSPPVTPEQAVKVAAGVVVDTSNGATSWIGS